MLKRAPTASSTLPRTNSKPSAAKGIAVMGSSEANRKLSLYQGAPKKLRKSGAVAAETTTHKKTKAQWQPSSHQCRLCRSTA